MYILHNIPVRFLHQKLYLISGYIAIILILWILEYFLDSEFLKLGLQ